MFCTKCGKEMPEGTKFCTACGNSLCPSEKSDISAEGSVRSKAPTDANGSLTGYSEKINDPSFEKYRKESKSWSYIFSFILAAIAIIAFPIYGKESGELEWPYSLYYGMGIGGMFIVIAFLQSFRRNHDSTWDGVVIDKKEGRKRDAGDDDQRAYMEYILVVRRDNGRKYKHKWRNHPGLYSYYNIGDKVRHHKGFMYYEKYDKSRDQQIMCAACMAFCDIRQDHCTRCSRPLLK